MRLQRLAGYICIGLALCPVAAAQQRVFTGGNENAFKRLDMLSQSQAQVAQPTVPGIAVSSRAYAPHMPVFEASSNQVQVSVVVRDRGGHSLAGLGRSAFSLYADGHEVPLNYFNASEPAAASSETAVVPTASKTEDSAPAAADAAPHYVALFFDDFSMTAQQLAIARNAAEKVAASGMQGVEMGIFTTSGSPNLGFTTDRAAWEHSISQLHPDTQMPEDGVTPGGRFNPYLAQLIQLNVKQYVDYGAQEMKKLGMCQQPDSCKAAAQAQADYTSDFARSSALDTLGALRQTVTDLAAQPGARTLVLASAGFTAENDEGQQALIEQALKAGIVIDSLDAKLLETEPTDASPIELELWSANQMSMDQVLQSIADETGGNYFHNNDIGGAMRQAALAPEARYVLGFSPTAMPADGKFHRLQVKVAGPSHISIQARRGYYDPAEGDWGNSSVAPATVDDWVLGAATPGDFSVTLGAGFRKFPTGGTEIELQIHVPVQQKREGVELVTAIFDPLGRFVTGRSFTLGLHLDGGELKNYAKSGVAVRFRLPLAPGVYRLREVAYRLDSQQRTIVDRAFEIPRLAN